MLAGHDQAAGAWMELLRGPDRGSPSFPPWQDGGVGFLGAISPFFLSGANRSADSRARVLLGRQRPLPQRRRRLPRQREQDDRGIESPVLANPDAAVVV
jgi:hypothetical protein